MLKAWISAESELLAMRGNLPDFQDIGLIGLGFDSSIEGSVAAIKYPPVLERSLRFPTAASVHAVKVTSKGSAVLSLWYLMPTCLWLYTSRINLFVSSKVFTVGLDN